MTGTKEGSPDYKVRVSHRARHVNLRVTPEAGLTITVPLSFDRRQLPAIIDEKRAWIERSLAWAGEQRRMSAGRGPAAIPVHIDLQALGETWRLLRRPTPAAGARVTERGFRELILSGNVYDTEASMRAVRRWLTRRARATLVPWLLEMGDSLGFRVASTSVRNQRSCWASCSPSGSVNLNIKLLFLHRELVRYVLVHELCHTVHLDHSRRFRDLVGSIEPSWRELDRRLAGAWESVPAWLAENSVGKGRPAAAVRQTGKGS